MIRWGLCCIFREEPITFRRTTARYLSKLSPNERMDYVSGICLHNANSLLEALKFCRLNGINAFRINSQILPLKTHPKLGYAIEALPQSNQIVNTFKKSDLRYQTEVAKWVNADVINIHAGGVYGDKDKALQRLVRGIRSLPQNIRRRLTLENDDRLYTPRDLLPICKKLKIPLVYDLHHHRCLPDGLNIKDATQQVLKTWNREPLFHISSPLQPWKDGNHRNHHDYINLRDFPVFWLNLDITVEVEAKAKELAVLKLMREIDIKQNNWI
jgi:UV DNA damage endonuclease